MSALLENAVASLQLGVEDYSANTARRTLSAVRNFYAGVLLLAKEALVCAAPEADPDEVIGSRYRPVPDGEGGVEYVQDGAQTVDFQTLERRFKDFGIRADAGQLRALNRIRNDIEHRYSEQSNAAIREVIATAFPLVSDLFRQIDESPAERLGEAWQIMLNTTQLYQQELNRCVATLSDVAWVSDTVRGAVFACPACGSGLVAQTEPHATTQEDVTLICRACGGSPELQAVIEVALEEALGADAYLRAKDEGADGPIYTCPDCGAEAFIDFEEACAVCGYATEETDCVRCGKTLTLDDQLYAETSGLCSYCAHMSEKIMRE
jgi:rubrerythrin